MTDHVLPLRGIQNLSIQNSFRLLEQGKKPQEIWCLISAALQYQPDRVRWSTTYQAHHVAGRVTSEAKRDFPEHRIQTNSSVIVLGPLPALLSVANSKRRLAWIKKMTTFSPLNNVVNQLEQHEKSLRIKKMMVCVCRNIWENDASKLANLSLQDLIQELRQLYPSIEQLTASLDKVVKSLNKPKEYGLVANTIIYYVSSLYPDPDAEDSTQLILTQPEDMTVPIDAPLRKNREAEHSQPPGSWELCDTRRAYDPFELRQEVMKYTNPLRAKILLFSTIERIFTFNQEDWLTIKSQELDDLLLRLFTECTTIEQLQYKLCETAKCLRDPSESNQAAGAIIQALRPFYSQGQGLSNPFNRNLAKSMSSMVNEQFFAGPMSATVSDEAPTGPMSATVIDEDDNDSTYQLLPS